MSSRTLNTLALLFVTLPLLNICLAAEPLATPDDELIEYPDDEPHSEAEIELGKTLFFDPRLSVNGQQSCATCHNPDLGFGDGLALGIGTMGDELDRNTPHLYNLAWNVTFFWDGRAATLEEQALGPIVSEVEMNMPLPQLVERLNDIEGYRAQFYNAYGESEISADLIGRAIAAFERSLVSKNSAFDRYLAGDKDAMLPEALRGMELFEGKGKCTDCHDGANMTDNSFHNIGLTSSDVGRESVVSDATLRGAFKTPGLRNVALTAPYMHNGSLGTLQEVIEFYNEGGHRALGRSNLIVPLGLTRTEVMDLVAFLGALTDPVIVTRPKLPKNQEVEVVSK